MGLFGVLRSKKKERACQSWIFLIVPEEFSWDGARRKEWAMEYLDTLDWTVVSNHDNKRFVCPKCSEDEV